ncbi:neprilysin-1 [Drosophila subpulchrella]|uniref:neprilysin-1 n=1 Tax=Drosophila subpulchrella TaxID=1486046 RepID=UPI0018A12F9E|nr:neprilysin-1 [Drosophila subpulchrella]
MEGHLTASACLIFLITLVIQGTSGGVFKELTTPLGQQIMRIAKSAEMRSFMDTNVSPCDDFYTHACGNYAVINAATEQKDTSMGQLLFAHYIRRVRQLLKEPRISTDRPTDVRVKYFYESCLNTTALRMKQRSHLLSVLREFGGMPAVQGTDWNPRKFDPLEMMAQLLRRYGKRTLLGVRVAPDFANSQIIRLYLGQRDDLSESRSYIRYMVFKKRLMTLLGVPEERAEKSASELYDLDLELSRNVPEPGTVRDPRLKNHLKGLSEMSDTYGPTLNLTRFVNIWLGHDYYLPVYESVPNYLIQVKEILLATPKHVLANYMLSTLLDDFEIDQDEGRQEEICAEKITDLFPDVVDQMVYHSLQQQSPHIANELRSLWLELKTSFQEILSSPDLKWLEEPTREELLEKVKGMSFEIAGDQAVNFEEQYGELVVSSADYYGNVQRLLEVQGTNLRRDLMRKSRSTNYYDGVIDSPFYVTENNLVVLPSSFMQHRYLFDDVYPAALKYGTLGFFLSHEMAHGFDDVGRLFDSKGNLNDTWSSQAKESFEWNKKCLAEQFGKMEYDGMALPKWQSQDQNIADNLGIRIAQSAYSKWLEQLNSQDTETLPHMPQTPKRLFFLGLAQSMCSDIWDDRRYSVVYHSTHPPDESRVFAMMTSSPAFAEAFQCSNTTRMNPLHKCTMY